MGSCIGFCPPASAALRGVENNARLAARPNMAGVSRVLLYGIADIALSWVGSFRYFPEISISGRSLRRSASLTYSRQKCCWSDKFAVLNCKNAGLGLE